MFPVDIPGGTATIRKADEVKVGPRRALTLHLMMFGEQRFVDVCEAQGATTEELADEIGLSDAEAEALEAISDVTILTLLDSWTLSDPVPTTTTEVRRLPPDVRGALADATAGEAARLIRGVMSWQ